MWSASSRRAAPTPSMTTASAGETSTAPGRWRVSHAGGRYRTSWPAASGARTPSSRSGHQSKKLCHQAMSSVCTTGAPRSPASIAANLDLPEPEPPSTATTRVRPRRGARCRISAATSCIARQPSPAVASPMTSHVRARGPLADPVPGPRTPLGGPLPTYHRTLCEVSRCSTGPAADPRSPASSPRPSPSPSRHCCCPRRTPGWPTRPASPPPRVSRARGSRASASWCSALPCSRPRSSREAVGAVWGSPCTPPSAC
jgi:hypothetical protein